MGIASTSSARVGAASGLPSGRAARKRSPLRRIGATIWLLLVVVGASVGGLFVLGASASRGSSFEPYSSFRSEPDGTMALHEWLRAERLGLQCRRETEDLRLLPNDRSLLILVAPYGFEPAPPPPPGRPAPPKFGFEEKDPFAPGELDAIVAWVRRGGRLLVLEGFPNPLYDALGVHVKGDGKARDDVVGTGSPAALALATARGAKLALANRATLEGPPDWITLYRDELGASVVLSGALDRGEVTVVADPSIATNVGIRRAGNRDFFLSLLEDAPSRIVRFDELRHGLASERNVMGFARRHGLHLALVQGGLAFVMAVWSAARPRRRAREAGRSRGIESREFVSAMANIYERAQLDRHAVASYLARCERAIALAVGKPPGAVPPADLAARLRSFGVRNFRGWETVEEEALALGVPVRGSTKTAAAPSRKDRIRERHLVSFARLATQLEREVREAKKISVDQVIA